VNLLELEKREKALCELLKPRVRSSVGYIKKREKVAQRSNLTPLTLGFR